jgi:hypothetical protein
VEEIFHEQKKQKPIAAVIIEPILAEGGKRSCFSFVYIEKCSYSTITNGRAL